MPKKFVGENSKAVATRERKATAKNETALKKQQEKEEEYWRDDDKQVAKKQNKKEELERKKHEQQKKRQEKEELLRAEEAAAEKQGRAKHQQPTRMTRAQVEAARQRVDHSERAARPSAAASSTSTGVLQEQAPLVDNVNRRQEDGSEARTVEQAIAVLRLEPEPEADRHPERRMKAAFRSYEEERLPQLRQENPGMRLTQVKNLLMKEWEKSPQNPMNQTHIAYNTKS